MALWSRIANVFRGDRLSREIQEELEEHIEEAIREGREPEEVRRAFGPALRMREESRDMRLLGWLDSLRADTIFGWRQILKKKVTSAAAILSLALAIGACTSAFRLIDALLLRPLPVKEPERLYNVSREGIAPDGNRVSYDAWAYPAFQQMRSAVKDEAELIAVAYANPTDLTYQSDQEMEKAFVQPVSGWMFDSFGLRPVVGRLLTENDDLKPRAHPYAVLSNDYWTRRFGRDPNAVGRTLRMGDDLYQIVGVVAGPFVGTEPGTVTDIFIPTMMHPGVVHDDWTWHRILVRLKPGVAVEPVRARLHAASQAFERERAKGFKGMSKESIDQFLDQTVVLDPAAAGASGLQQNYRRSLIALAVLVGLVLLIACANVANLMTAQAAARGREMALRVSIGAGRWRLVQLVLVESAMLAVMAAAMGGLFAWRAAPFVVGRINPPDNPARLDLAADWRVLAFGMALTLAVIVLFGLTPALRASAVKPASALKGGEDPHSRRRLMHALIGAQVAFCFLVLFVAGLFAATFDKLSHRPVGFSPERVLTLETIAQKPAPPVFWNQAAEHLRDVPGVESVALAGWALMGIGGWNGFISVDGAPPGPVLAYFLAVSPGWTETLKIPFLEGGDFRRDNASADVAIVNETFGKQFFDGRNPVGRSFKKGDSRYRIVGVVRDVRYRDMREAPVPQAYVPFGINHLNDVLQPVRNGTFIVRTSSPNPLAMAAVLRREVSRARPELRVSNIRSQVEINETHTVRERLLAMLGLFFAGVALVLAGIGLYGVLDYSVLKRRREIGIRMAIGARAGDIARRVTGEVFAMVLAGAAAGVGIGLVSARFMETLLYGVKAIDLTMLTLPSAMIFIAAMLAALVPVIRAVRIDPVAMLRTE